MEKLIISLDLLYIIFKKYIKTEIFILLIKEIWRGLPSQGKYVTKKAICNEPRQFLNNKENFAPPIRMFLTSFNKL